MSKINWCECDQMPGCHDSVDCDNDVPVKDPKAWLKENICAMIDDDIKTGETDKEYYFNVTPCTFSYGESVTFNEELLEKVVDWKGINK